MKMICRICNEFIRYEDSYELTHVPKIVGAWIGGEGRSYCKTAKINKNGMRLHEPSKELNVIRLLNKIDNI